MTEPTAPACPDTPEMSSTYDVAIVGGGAAGLSAALVLARARRRVLVVDGASPRNSPAAHMHGFLSRDGMPPADLLAVGRDEVARYGGDVVVDAVSDIAAAAVDDLPRFRLTLGRGCAAARRLLVATGLRDELPEITGLRQRWARDVLHCPYCHGWEVRDKRLGVLADGSPESLRYAHIVRQWATDLLVLAPSGALSEQQAAELAARGIGLVAGNVSRVLVADDHLVGVELADGRVVLRDALFVPPRLMPNTDLLTRLGAEIDERGWVKHDHVGRTTVPGVWVAGNVANPRAQVITAAGEGSAAAIDLNADLVDEDVRLAVRAASTTADFQTKETR